MAKRLRTRIRDAISGQFVQAYEAMPDTSIVETVSDAPQVEADLRWRCAALTAALNGAAGEMDVAFRAIKTLDYQGALNVLERAAGEARVVAGAHIPEETA